MFCGKDIPSWQEIKNIYGYIWITSILVCPFMAIFIYPLFDE